KKKLQFVVHDFVDGFDTYTEQRGYTWPADVAFADVDPAQYVALGGPGGGGVPSTSVTTRTVSGSSGTSSSTSCPWPSSVTRRSRSPRPVSCADGARRPIQPWSPTSGRRGPSSWMRRQWWTG